MCCNTSTPRGAAIAYRLRFAPLLARPQAKIPLRSIFTLRFALALALCGPETVVRGRKCRGGFRHGITGNAV